jgi:hypothetical protein
MQDDPPSRYLTRAGILERLSEEEVANASTAETIERIAYGDEYVDLAHIEQGVQRWRTETTLMGRLLPRKSIHEPTWLSVMDADPMSILDLDEGAT